MFTQLYFRSTDRIEEDFYFGNPDALIFLMKEFKAHLSPELTYQKANPFLIAKLDVEVRNSI